MMGAVTGAGMVALLFLALFVRDDGITRVVRYLPFLAFIFICAFAGWTVGLFALAAPAWWLLHRINVRSLPAALLLGAIGAFLGHLGLEATGLRALNYAIHQAFSGDPMMPENRYQAAVALSVVGVIVAAVIWRKAYRRVDQPA
jgi:hypothetical protein